MKRTLLNLLAIVTVTFVCVGCGGSDSDSGELSGNPLTGIWASETHYYGGTDYFYLKSDGSCTWTYRGTISFDDMSGNWYYDEQTRILTLSLKSLRTGYVTTRVYTILSLTSTSFVMMDEDGYSYTYNKKNEYPGDNDGNNTNNTNNNGGSVNGYNNGHAYVDLGLSVKWATMNIGAGSPEDYGSIFAWGETTTKSTYNWKTYKYCKGSIDTMTKYCTSSSYGTVDNKTVLDLSDDAARANWGGTWRMPTYDECKELVDKCTTTWTSLNGVKGRKVTGPNGNSIFFPAAGCLDDSSLYGAGSCGYYGSSSLDTSDPAYGWYLYFRLKVFSMSSDGRSGGHSVRAVCP